MDKTLDKQPDTPLKIFPLSHLASISVTGADNAKFLQGQLTCDIFSLSDSLASIAGFCNPKGRVISTLLVLKTNDSFLLLLPRSLLNKVITKLQMYILRSAVRLGDENQGLKLFGFSCPATEIGSLKLPTENFAVGRGGDGNLFVRLPSPSPRYLCIANQQDALSQLDQHNGHLVADDSAEWLFQDISSGFPWFDSEQSELYIPQMLNIDGLGGISFNKGCYTGQEIIARTHFLGKAKRNLFPAECSAATETPAAGISVLNDETKQSVGAVLSAITYAQNTRLLLVLQVSDAEAHQLVLDDAKQTAIKIVPIQ